MRKYDNKDGKKGSSPLFNMANVVLGNETKKVYSSSRHERVTKAEKQQAFHKRSQIHQLFHKQQKKKK